MCSNDFGSNLAHGISLGTFGSPRCPPSKEFLIDMLSETFTLALYRTMNECVHVNNLSQAIQLECINDGSYTTPYETNKGCAACLDTVQASFKDLHRLERLMRERDGGPTRVKIQDGYERMANDLRACGTARCKLCNFDDLSQRILFNTPQKEGTGFINVTNSCHTDTTFQDRFESNLEARLNTLLTRDESALGVMSNMLQTTDATEVTRLLKQRLTETSIVEIVNDFQSKGGGRNNISITLVNGGTIQAFDQSAIITSFTEYLSNAKIVSGIFQDSEWENGAKIMEQNTSLTDTGEFIFAPILTLVDVLDSITGQIMLGALIVLGGLLVFIAGALVLRRAVPTREDVSDEGQAELAAES